MRCHCLNPARWHPLAARDTVSLEELVQQEFLLTERGMSYRDALDQCLAAHGLQLQPYLELGSAALLCQMVERGMSLPEAPGHAEHSTRHRSPSPAHSGHSVESLLACSASEPAPQTSSHPASAPAPAEQGLAMAR